MKIPYLKKIFSSKLKKETTWAIIAKAISAVSGIIILYILPKFWGIELYGYFSIILAYIVIVEIFFGNSINVAMKREIVKHKFGAKGKIFFLHSLKIKFVWFILGALVMFLIINSLEWVLLKDNYLFFISLLFLMNFWGMVVNAFEASHRIFYVTLMYILEYTTKLTLILVFMFSNLISIDTLLFSFIAGYFVAFIFGFSIILFKFRIGVKDLFFKMNKKIYQRLLWRTFYLTLVTASFVILTRIDTIMISFFLQIEDVGFYNIASELTRNAAIIGVALVTGVVPLFIKKDRRDLFVSTLKKLLIVNLIIFMGFLLLADPLMNVVYGQGFEKVSILIKILAIYPLLLSLQYLSSEILILRDKIKNIFINGLIAVALNIILNMLFILIWGVYGVAIATIIAYSTWFFLNYIALKKII